MAVTVGLRDVAVHAGVSVKTVSNVVRGTVRVSPATRERVEQSLTALGYRPNLAARTLRSGRTGVVALGLPALDAPYFSALARAVISAAADHGWTVLIDQTDGRAEREAELLDGLGTLLVDGVLLSPLGLDATALGPRSSHLPLVLLGERVADGAHDHVAIDNVTAARDAVTHLLAAGRRRVAAVGAQDGESAATARLRLQGWREAHALAGTAPPADLVATVGSFDLAEGAAAAHRLLALPDPPDALFCFDDLLALGALRALAVRGVRVPQQVAVAGFDDVEQAAYAVPSLTSVRPDLTALATEAVRLLAERVGGVAGPGRDVTVGHRLVPRESTGAG